MTALPADRPLVKLLLKSSDLPAALFSLYFFSVLLQAGLMGFKWLVLTGVGFTIQNGQTTTFFWAIGLVLGQGALTLLGFAPYEAYRLKRIFRKKDELIERPRFFQIMFEIEWLLGEAVTLSPDY